MLVTGFGPFPGAPENPTDALVRALAKEPAEAFGVGAFRAVVLKTDYLRSWAALRRLCSSFAPDVVVHFGLNARADALHIECVGRNCVDPAKVDAAGYAPVSGVVARGGADTLASTFPAAVIAAALSRAGFPATLSDHAGDYVCNAMLYRSLRAAPPTRRVGLVHVPAENRLRPEQLLAAARVVLRAAVEGEDRKLQKIARQKVTRG
jgi:pyroglutamyl-peptidase